MLSPQGASNCCSLCPDCSPFSSNHGCLFLILQASSQCKRSQVAFSDHLGQTDSSSLFYITHHHLKLSCWFFIFFLKTFFFFGLFSYKTESSKTVQGLCLSYLQLSSWSQEQSLAQSKCSVSVCGMNEWVNEEMRGGGSLKSPEVRSQTRVARFCKYKYRVPSYTWISDKQGMHAILNLYMSQILHAFLVYVKFKCNWVSCIISGRPTPDPLQSLCELSKAKETFSNLCLVDPYGLE